MHVVGRMRLEKFVEIHSDAAPAIDAWLREATDATWRKPADVKARYPSVSFLPNNRVVFNLRGNKYRLDTQMAYQTEVIVVKRIGTHAEYDHWSFDK